MQAHTIVQPCSNAQQTSIKNQFLKIVTSTFCNFLNVQRQNSIQGTVGVSYVQVATSDG